MMGIRTIVPPVTSTLWQQFREAWMIQRSTMHSFSPTALLMPLGSGCTISQGTIFQLQISGKYFVDETLLFSSIRFPQALSTCPGY